MFDAFQPATIKAHDISDVRDALYLAINALQSEIDKAHDHGGYLDGPSAFPFNGYNIAVNILQDFDRQLVAAKQEQAA